MVDPAAVDPLNAPLGTGVFGAPPPQLVATEADMRAARAEVPSGSATFSGTMTTVTPAAALVGLFAIWYASKYGHPLPDAGIIYATIIVTAVAHGVKTLLTKLYPSFFSNAPTPAPQSFGYHDYHGHNP